ncbi:MAG: hypothetical protein EOP04_26515 [Proteobacteria bacterium]|nr:MAG: hypothetical protein EOP04_26515 [Pseudomonadota bacterium]
MFVAWVGNSHHVIPFVHLGMLSKINAVVGVSFCQTHPNGLQFLIDAGVDLRIAKIGAGKKEVLFHPKVYVFSSNQKRAVFMGSSNFTLNGFHKNFESNVLIEGLASDSEIAGVEKELSKWRNEEYSFLPGEIWLKGYEDRYNKRRQKIKEAGLDDEADVEEQSSGAATWLAIAHWDVYLKEVRKGLQVDSAVNNESLQQRISLFKRFEKDLALPWEIDYFSDIEKRRLIGGMGQYGWLGHVGASGDFRRMLANGTNKEHRTIIATINEIAALSLPIEWLLLSALLYKLTALCPTMKVWGRLLAIVRPDIYCTISAPHVRKNIAVEIGQPERFLEGVEGYIMLLQLVHSSPWFQSDPPVKRSELDIWKRRVAFLDVVFYNF